MPAISVRECKTAAEVFTNYRGVKERREARERVCLMKDLDNTALAPRPNDRAAAKFQQPVVELPPVVAEPHAAVVFVQNNAPWNDDMPIFPFISLTKIIFVVAQFYKLKPIDLVSHRREIRIVRPRQIVAYLAKELTPFSLPTIGRRLGDRDHTTILHAVRKIKELMKEDEGLAIIVNGLRDALLEFANRNQKLSAASSSAT